MSPYSKVLRSSLSERRRRSLAVARPFLTRRCLSKKPSIREEGKFSEAVAENQVFVSDWGLPRYWR